jgi:hypothetical protein
LEAGEKQREGIVLEALQVPSPWPNANARLLGFGLGLPVSAIDRLKNFSDKEFERFTLEWATGYLPNHVTSVYEIQQRGGSGDKGRDIILWRDPPETMPRRWRLYQCKHYADRLTAPEGYVEIAKVLFYTLRGDFTPPEQYWFVTHQGVAGTLQDLLDAPDKLKAAILENWEKCCANKITSKLTISLTPELRAHIEAFDFSIFRAKQPLTLIEEHAQTKFHAIVFGLPLIERPPPPKPPSTVHAQENGYIDQLFSVIAQHLGIPVSAVKDFAHSTAMQQLFDRSRLTFYSAEGLKELARDQMADQAFFDTLLDEFCDGLYHAYANTGQAGLERLRETVKAAQSLQLGGHVLAMHVTANDREGACHQLANDARVQWCEP